MLTTCSEERGVLVVGLQVDAFPLKHHSLLASEPLGPLPFWAPFTSDELCDRSSFWWMRTETVTGAEMGGGHPLRSTLTFWPCDLGEGPPLPDNWSSSVSWVWRRLCEITKGVTST